MYKLTKEDVVRNTKEELLLSLSSYLEEQINLSVRKTRDEDSFSIPSWAEYQAYHLGMQKAFYKVIEFLPLTKGK
jgi:hypothetical protein